MPTLPPKPPFALDSLDFEVTDFDAAKRSLDELPAGVLEVQRMRRGNWEGLRRKPLPTDRALTGASMDWVVHLPPGLRPHTICEQFPRVANLLADTWGDVAYSFQVIDQLLSDRRGGRRGFPVAVQTELKALQEHQRARLRR